VVVRQSRAVLAQRDGQGERLVRVRLRLRLRLRVRVRVRARVRARVRVRVRVRVSAMGRESASEGGSSGLKIELR